MLDAYGKDSNILELILGRHLHDNFHVSKKVMQLLHSLHGGLEVLRNPEIRV